MTLRKYKRKRNIQTLNAMMSNSETIINATADAMNAQGSALIENEIYLNSINGRLSILNSEWQNFWNNSINSETAKSLVDFAGGLVKIADSLGLLGIALITTSAILVAKFWAGSTAANALAMSFFKLVPAIGLSQTAIVGLSGALATLLPVALIAGIVMLAKVFKDVETEAESVLSHVNNLNESFANQSRELEDLRDQYTYLNAQESLNADEVVKLIRLESDLKTKYGETANELDFVNGKLEDNLAIMDSIKRADLKTYIDDLRVSYQYLQSAVDNFIVDTGDAFSTVLTRYIDNFGGIDEAIVGLQEKISGMNSFFQQGARTALEGYLRQLIALRNEYNNTARAIAQLSYQGSGMTTTERDAELARLAKKPVKTPPPPDGGGDVRSSSSSKASAPTPKVLEDYFYQLQRIEEVQDIITSTQAKRNLLDEESVTYLEDLYKMGQQEKKQVEALILSYTTLNKSRQKDLDALVSSGKKDAETMEKIYSLKNNIRDTDNDILKLRKDTLSIDKNIADQIAKANEALEKQREESRKKAEEEAKAQAEAYKKRIEEEKRRVSEKYDLQIKAIQEEISNLKGRNQEEERRIKLLEKQEELQKALLKLQNIQAERNVRIFMGEEEGWIWSADPRAVREQTEVISGLEKELVKIEKENALQDLIESKEREIKELESSKQREEDRYSAIIDKIDTNPKIGSGSSSSKNNSSGGMGVPQPVNSYREGGSQYYKMSDGSIIKNDRVVDPSNYKYVPSEVGGTRSSSSSTNSKTSNYNVSIGEVVTNDAREFMENLKNYASINSGA